MKFVIASGKGGTGKTTVAVNLFEALRMEDNIQVEIIDADVEEPNVHLFLAKEAADIHWETTVVEAKIPAINKDNCTFCGRCVHFCEYDAIIMQEENQHIEVVEDLCTSCGACLYACNDGAITEEEVCIGKLGVYNYENKHLLEGRLDVGKPFAAPIIKSLKALKNPNRISIIDSPPGISRTVVEVMYDAEFIIVVAEPSPFGLNDLKLMVKTLTNMRKDFGVVINRSYGEYKEVHHFLEKKQIPLLMEIPFKREYAKLNSQIELLIHHDEDLRLKFIALFEEAKNIYIQKSMYR